MAIRVDGIRLNLEEDENLVLSKACKKANLRQEKIKYFKILKKSIDARYGDVHFVYSVEIGEQKPADIIVATKKYSIPKKPIAIVGSGPAGLFCGLVLARNGFKPIIIERGEKVEDRIKTVNKFTSTGELNVSSNIQFGEGGAGTFSDGKLNTGVKSEYREFILKEFVSHGAPEEILYNSKPHIGSDNLPKVVKNIREEIISLGGSFLFNTTFIGFTKKGDEIATIICKNQKEFEIEVSSLILACGHSSRDTFEMLFSKGVFMESKDMAVGFRIEHKQLDVNKSQYGKYYDNKKLGSADYKLTSNVSDRGVFTFCMCPGGEVVPATSEVGMVCTNGMSNYKRDMVNANSAVIVQVKKKDYMGDGALAGIEFQRNLERKAYEMGGGNYKAPIQLVGDFIKGKTSKELGEIKPSYSLGTNFAPLHLLLTKEMTTAIQKGILDMEKRLKGFSKSDAVLTGVESRTSSPVRVVRNEKLHSITIANLYPAGEVGYAGGIMSASIDGIKIANILMQKYIC